MKVLYTLLPYYIILYMLYGGGVLIKASNYIFGIVHILDRWTYFGNSIELCRGM